MDISDDQQYPNNGKNTIIQSKTGYWKSVDTVQISTSTDIVGVKVSLDHYEGQAPSGKRTGWVMNQYLVKQNDEANVPQDYKNLCTIFFQGEKNINAGDKQISVNANAPRDCKESYVQYLAKLEEQHSSWNRIVVANEQNDSSSKGQGEQKTSALNDQTVDYALPGEAYIELNDLLSSDASASTSEYSSRRSMISEEYFDSDAFLREIRNTAAPTKSDCEVISTPEQGFADNHATVAGTSPQKSGQSDKVHQHSSEEAPRHSPASSSFLRSHVNRSRSRSWPGTSKSPQRERSTSKFGKLGKKYCCFGSF
ncbi:hypothetical protein GUJ93_ZPchr0010g7312 [Zizania palustris]|nr:hypothetical protein GUJ93_ZPchr0010g7312 [Zizania palustris]